MKNLLITTSILLLASCAAQTVAPKVSKAELYEEQRIQRDLVKQQKYAELDAAPVADEAMKARFIRIANLVAVAGKDLCTQINEKSCGFDFELSQDKILNAYADGSKVVITTAMMNFASKDEELANVMAHEYAHNIMKHVQSKQGNAMIGTLAGVLIDSYLGGGGNAATQLGQNIGAGSYSVAFEQEADYVGLYIFARTGYDPNEAIEFWRKMSVANESAIDHGVTHPTNPQRFVAMKKTIAEINAKKASGQALVPRFKK